MAHLDDVRANGGTVKVNAKKTVSTAGKVAQSLPSTQTSAKVQNAVQAKTPSSGAVYAANNAVQKATNAVNSVKNTATKSKQPSTQPKTPSGSGSSGGGYTAAVQNVAQPEVNPELEAYKAELAKWQQMYADLESDYNDFEPYTVDYEGTDTSAYERAIAEQKRAYEDALAKQQAAIQAARDQSVNTLNNQRAATEGQYADLYRQLYIDKMKSQKNIDQQMAAQGLTGGQSESTLLGIDTNYADNLRQGKNAETSAYRDIDTAIANAKLASGAEEANAIANNITQKSNSYTSAMQNLLNLAAQENQARVNLAAQQASENRKYAYDTENTNRQYAYNYAMAMLNNGQMPSAEMLSKIGLSQADAAAIVAGNTAKASSASGGVRSGSSNNGSDNGISGSQSVYNAAMNLAQKDGRNTGLSYIRDAYNNGLISQAEYVQYKNTLSQSF